MTRLLALTMGEPGGIGPELALLSWLARDSIGAPFVLFADPGLIRARALALSLDVPVAECAPAAAESVFSGALPVAPLRARAGNQPGRPEAINAPAVIESIERAVEAVARGEAHAAVTNPIQKSSLYAAGFAHPGHTEFLGELASRHYGGTYLPVMMLAADVLRVVPVTIHIPLADVPRQLTTDLIIRTAMITARDLETRFGLPRPRLAIAGLNPHAGESGTIGLEDEAIVRPAVDALARQGLDVTGPLPADTMFHAAARRRYDAAICMYHDQALIPVKTLAFDTGVNVTLGLPFIRTSPDHGTALDIAGTGKADPGSLIAALRLAARMTALPR